MAARGRGVHAGVRTRPSLLYTETMPDPVPTSASSPPAAWLDRLPASVVVILDSRVHYVNQAAQKLLEAASPDQLLGRVVPEFVHPLDLHRVLARIQWAECSEGSNPPTEFRAYTCTGRQVVLAMTSNHVQIDGRSGVLAAFLDMTERVAMEQRLLETDQNFQRIMNTMQDVFYRTDAQGITRYVCPAVKNVLGYSAEEIIGLPAAAFYPDQREREALVAAVRANGFVHDFPGRMRRKDGRIIDISISTNALRDEQGQYAGVEGIWRDITQRKEMERELERLATRDDLTGLANRRHILDALDRAFKRRGGHRNAPPFCALVMDLDHFKCINDTHGHAAGDAVLRSIVRIVEAQSRTGDQMGRLGGEEFLLLLEWADLAAATEVAERIRSAVHAASIELGPDLRVSLTLSIGISCWLHTDGQSTDLLERADRALYRAKAQGRNAVCSG
jgi:diguanylate cyclase (GGDEF)-like protein/PAS domain S-box-containing protein